MGNVVEVCYCFILNYSYMCVYCPEINLFTLYTKLKNT